MTMKRINSTFGGGKPTWANACVGDNGQPGYLEYARGFSQAANLLIDTVIENDGRNFNVDEFIYPVCFNMRHSVELRLKAAVSDLIALQEIRGAQLEFDLAGSHDIGLIWRFFLEKSVVVDNRYIPVNAQLDSFIADIAEIDATGQTFRYPYDNDNKKKHLIEVAIINFCRLKRAFKGLEEALDNLHQLNSYLIEEYGMRTFTRNLSRNNLFQLASLLPQRSEWSNASFDITKAAIKKRFAIGSKEFSESLNIIQSNFEFSPLIGKSLPLHGINSRDLLNHVDCWWRLHADSLEKIASRGPVYEPENFFSEMIRDAETRSEIWELVGPTLTPQIMAGIAALFYFAHDFGFSERYVRRYDEHLIEYTAKFKRSLDEVRESYFHILDKTNMARHLLGSLYFLKKGELADQIVSAYGLEQMFSWLDDARSGIRFRKPALYGYQVERQ